MLWQGSFSGIFGRRIRLLLAARRCLFGAVTERCLSSEAGGLGRGTHCCSLLGGSGRYDDISFVVPTILLTACSDHPIAPDVLLCKCRSV